MYILLYIFYVLYNFIFISLVPDAIPRNIKGLGSSLFFRNNMEISWEVMDR